MALVQLPQISLLDGQLRVTVGVEDTTMETRNIQTVNTVSSGVVRARVTYHDGTIAFQGIISSGTNNTNIPGPKRIILATDTDWPNISVSVGPA